MKQLALPITLAVHLCAGIALADSPPAPPTPPPTPTAAADTDKDSDEDDGKPRKGVSVHIGSSSDDDDPVMVLQKLPPDVRRQLTPDQLEQIIRRAQEDRGSTAHSATEILVPGFFFATVLGIVAAVLLGRHRREQMLHATLRAMIEKGTDIPRELLVFDKKKPNDRRRGIVLTGVGLSLMALLALVDSEKNGAWAFGLVPLFLGLGYLLAWFVERRDPTT